jgi:TatD DNase family protein
MDLKLFDTHAHVNFNAYKDDADDVIRRSLDAGMEIINVGSNYATSQRAVEIAEKYEKGVYAAIGLHPIHLETGLVKIKDDPEEIQFRATEESFDYEKYKKFAGFSKKVVAIGECGFDYYWKPKTTGRLEQFKEKQKTAFFEQAKLAHELDLPLIIHCRMAWDDLTGALGELKAENYDLKGVIHCFTGNWEQAQIYMNFGFSIGLNGIIFKLNLDEAIKQIPLEKIVLETDCPYLTPPAAAGRNEPLYARYVAEKVASLKNLSYEELALATAENAKRLFKLGGK